MNYFTKMKKIEIYLNVKLYICVQEKNILYILNIGENLITGLSCAAIRPKREFDKNRF